jgi:hypothetical protein
MGEQTRESIIEAAKAAALQKGDTISRSDFMRHSGISSYHLYRLFPDGGWSEVQRLAGLKQHADNDPISDDDLLAEFHRVATEQRRIPTWHKFGAVAKISESTIKRRFGGSQGILKAYREWLERNAPDSPLLADLSETTNREIQQPAQPPATESTKPSAWAKLDGIEYGAPINFRGLRHAPINEQGVVYLFGMVSNELGLIVEAVQAGFPDCEAKRCVNPRENRWQRVRIEFEFRSRNFVDHGHDPARCDLVVCWEHNWPDCPLEIIELRSVLGRLES